METDRYGVVQYWTAEVPEGLVVASMGQAAVDACWSRIKSGWDGCLGRLNDGTQFRLLQVEHEAAWWLEVDHSSTGPTPRSWLFSRNLGGDVPEIEEVEL